MATLYLFRCPACGYEVRSSGGADAYMMCDTVAIVCKTCKVVTDVVTHSLDLGNLSMSDTVKGPVPLRCPVNKAHEVVPWDPKHPCPKCGKGMDASEADVILAD